MAEAGEKIQIRTILADSGAYTLLSDGYVFAYNDSASNTLSSIQICDSKGNEMCNVTLNGQMGIPVYVRKGMIVKKSPYNLNLPSDVYFVPFKA